MMRNKDLISRATRTAFRETLVGYVLREIGDFFEDAGVELGQLSADSMISGQRRTLVEEYYASVDWTRPSSVRPVVAAYEAILIDISSRVADPLASGLGPLKAEFDKLVQLLRRDGWIWDGGRLQRDGGGRGLGDLASLSEHFDTAVLQEHIARIQLAAETDPTLAIGSAKELVESVCKLVLRHHGEPEEKKREQIPQLVSRALDCLDLKAEKIPDAAKAATSSKKVLGSLAGVVQGMAELRNHYGTGHGRARTGGLRTRHADLMVGASVTIVRFMMATYDERTRAEISP